MPVELLEPDTHIAIRYPATRKRRIAFNVEANDPVTTYIVDKDGLDQFYAGEDIEAFGGFHRRRTHYDDDVRIPPNKPWYLVIMNKEDHPVAVSYDVSS